MRQVPFLSQEAVEAKVRASLALLDRRAGLPDISLDGICDSLTRAGVVFDGAARLGVDAFGREVLGRTSVRPAQVQVSDRLEEGSPRWRFTLAHELGHLALHRRLLNAPSLAHLQTEVSLLAEDRFSDIDRLEFQANKFAAALLMPRGQVEVMVAEHLEVNRMRPRGSWVLLVDDQPCNSGPYKWLLKKMTSKFRVSVSAAEYRLKSLGLLDDRRRRARQTEDHLIRMFLRWPQKTRR